VKKNKKGFTLIELLAVIVILGLLMAIAIPSITRYITQSRKKTAVSTAQNYMSALINEVNALEYTFTGTNTVYAVPIECISVERGGKSPFGEWLQANNAYWGYVLVQYDELNSSYTYGFTFKDSAGYGMYPTSEDKITSDGSQIQTGLDLKRPKNDKITNITALENWNGFNVDNNTKLVVLESAPEGDIGDGEETCTLCQKGPNYQIAEDEKKDLYKSEEEIKAEQEAAQKEEDFEKNPYSYALYFTDKSLMFIRSDKTVKSGDIVEGKTVSKVFSGTNATTGFEKVEYEDYKSVPWYNQRELITSVTFRDRIYPISTANWFKDFIECESFDVTNLKTSNVTNMYRMFSRAAFEGDSKKFSIVGLNEWNTSKVTNMSNMFYRVGMYSTAWSIGDLSKWDTSSVINMRAMFQEAGYETTSWSIGDLSEWDVSKVTNMYMLFAQAGYKSTTFNLGNLGNWDTSSVETMYALFSSAGYNATTWTVGDLSTWNTSNVTEMYAVFSSAGRNAKVFNVGDLSEKTVIKSDGSTYIAWDTSNVTSMSDMFCSAGYNSTTFKIGDISNWNTSNVESMYQMFAYAGKKASWSLNCSNWNIVKIKNKNYFNKGVETKVIAPNG